MRPHQRVNRHALRTSDCLQQFGIRQVAQGPAGTLRQAGLGLRDRMPVRQQLGFGQFVAGAQVLMQIPLVAIPLVGRGDQREGLPLGLPDFSEVRADEEIATVEQAGHLLLEYPPSSMTERHDSAIQGLA
jgi:hypothetical protein